MKFYFKKVILWCNNGTKREVEFQPNKVNVITGGSGTGKTAILQIIDYCLFASEHKISEDVINENVKWYGIHFVINDKDYFIARQAPIFKKVSNNYYFSSLGEEPIGEPSITDTDDKKLKKNLESEFSITNSVIMPYGANGIRKDTKISLRYFLLFNTLSYSTIDNEDIFFDKQNVQRYRDALGRIFDLSLGIETIENIVHRETKIKLEEKLEKLQKKEDNISIKQNSFYNEIAVLFKKSKEYGLIESDADIEYSVENLNAIVTDTLNIVKERKTEQYQSIKKDIYLFRKKIDNLRGFENEYILYKNNLRETEDSLKPIIYLNQNENEIIKTSIFTIIIDALEKDFGIIKKAIKNKTPIDIKVTNLIKEYEGKIRKLEEKLKEIPDQVKNFEDDIEMYVFLGEIKSKLELYNNKEQRIIPKQYDTTEIEDQLNKLVINDTSEQKKLTISFLEEMIQDDINFLKDALDNYQHHRSAFNYKDKKLELRQPHSDKVVNTGSSSIDMFLHILLFLGIHKVILSNEVPYIAPYLIMDQPSKPYYGDEGDDYKNIKETDQFKIEYVFKLLNNFMNSVIKDNNDFQIIVFEHVPTTLFDKLENIYLVEEFRNGNALIKENNKT